MYLEHIFFSTAIALLVGLVALKLHRRDLSWMIIVLAFVPDADVPLQLGDFILRWLFHTSLPVDVMSLHAQLHTLGALLIFSLVAALVLYRFGIPLLSGFVYSSLGYGAHLFEDALVYPNGYTLLWPLIPDKVGLGWFGTYTTNFFRIADVRVLLVGLLFLLFAVILYRYVTGKSYFARY